MSEASALEQKTNSGSEPASDVEKDANQGMADPDHPLSATALRFAASSRTFDLTDDPSRKLLHEVFQMQKQLPFTISPYFSPFLQACYFNSLSIF